MTWNEQQRNDYARLLHSALAVDDSGIAELNQSVMEKIKEQTAAKKHRIPAPVLAAVLILLFSLTAYAASRLLTAGQVSQSMGYEGLAEAFQSEDAVYIHETQTSHGYDISLLGITFGSTLQELFPDIEISSDLVYAVVAMSDADGTPLPDLSDESAADTVPDLYLTFLAKGYRADSNPLDLRQRDSCYLDGIYYYLVQGTDLARYSDGTLYLAVNQGIFCSPQDFLMDPITGTFSLNDTHDNIHALFEITLEETLLEKFSSGIGPAGESVLQADLSDASVTPPGADSAAGTASAPGADSAAGTDSAAGADSTVGIISISGKMPVYPGWTDDQIAQLNALSLPDPILYVAEDRILTAAWTSPGIASTVRIYDYTGTLLVEKQLLPDMDCLRQEDPVCTPVGFALASDSGYQVYDYDGQLLYQFNLEDIPSDYPPVAISVSSSRPDGSDEPFTCTGYYCAGGTFSSDLRYFCCQTLIDDNGAALTEGWLYDSVNDTWKLLYHGSRESEDYGSVSFFTCTPSCNGAYALFTGSYVKDKDSRLPVTSTPCYGILSMDTGEILLLRDGSADTVAEAGDVFFLNFDTLHNRSGRLEFLDLTDLSVASLPLEANDEFCSQHISPDGRWILSTKEEWEDHLYHCRIYDRQTGVRSEEFDLQTGIVSGEFDLQFADQSRAYFACYPGGYVMINFHNTCFEFHSYEENMIR